MGHNAAHLNPTYQPSPGLGNPGLLEAPKGGTHTPAGKNSWIDSQSPVVKFKKLPDTTNELDNCVVLIPSDIAVKNKIRNVRFLDPIHFDAPTLKCGQELLETLLIDGNRIN